MYLQKIHRLFRNIDYDNVDNFHLIAISNLQDMERRMERWWEKKFRTPLKPYLDHTSEELYIGYLEDYYEKNPEEIKRFMDSYNNEKVQDWDGKLDDELELAMQAKWKKKKAIDLSQFQSDTKLSEEEEQALLDNLGKDLKKSVVVKNKVVEEEFDDSFLGE